MTRGGALALGLAALTALGAALAVTARSSPPAACGPGFLRVGARCCTRPDGACTAGPTCPAPLVPTALGCDAPRLRVRIPGGRLVVGPSDWEAQGVVEPGSASVEDFELDVFEITAGAAFCAECPVPSDARLAGDPGRAAPLSFEEAARVCAARGGRLPTDDEWLVAAGRGAPGATTPSRYPWGEAGAVCRRAAFGLVAGPCAQGGSGPDTVGTHAAGASPSGVQDLAGNVAEWTRDGHGPRAFARGGSWASALAAEIRTWSRAEPARGAVDPRVGARCAYDVR